MAAVLVDKLAGVHSPTGDMVIRSSSLMSLRKSMRRQLQAAAEQPVGDSEGGEGVGGRRRGKGGSGPQLKQDGADSTSAPQQKARGGRRGSRRGDDAGVAQEEATNGRRGTKRRVEEDNTQAPEPLLGKKCLRATVVEFKEGILQRLISTRNAKQQELQQIEQEQQQTRSQRSPAKPRKPPESAGTGQPVLANHASHHHGAVSRGVTSPRSNGGPDVSGLNYDDDDTPPLILSEEATPQHAVPLSAAWARGVAVPGLQATGGMSAYGMPPRGKAEFGKAQQPQTAHHPGMPVPLLPLPAVGSTLGQVQGVPPAAAAGRRPGEQGYGAHGPGYAPTPGVPAPIPPSPYGQLPAFAISHMSPAAMASLMQSGAMAMPGAPGANIPGGAAPGYPSPVMLPLLNAASMGILQPHLYPGLVPPGAQTQAQTGAGGAVTSISGLQSPLGLAAAPQTPVTTTSTPIPSATAPPMTVDALSRRAVQGPSPAQSPSKTPLVGPSIAAPPRGAAKGVQAPAPVSPGVVAAPAPSPFLQARPQLQIPSSQPPHPPSAAPQQQHPPPSAPLRPSGPSADHVRAPSAAQASPITVHPPPVTASHAPLVTIPSDKQQVPATSAVVAPPATPSPPVPPQSVDSQSTGAGVPSPERAKAQAAEVSAAQASRQSSAPARVPRPRAVHPPILVTVVHLAVPELPAIRQGVPPAQDKREVPKPEPMTHRRAYGPVLGGLKRRKLDAEPVAVDVGQGEDDKVSALLSRRESLLQSLQAKGLSHAVNRPALLPAPRRKTHWDYLLEEMRWMATDFHEERKWKRAAGRVMSQSVVAEAKRRLGGKVGATEEARKVCHRLTQGVSNFWRSLGSQLRVDSELEVHVEDQSSEGEDSEVPRAIELSQEEVGKLVQAAVAATKAAQQVPPMQSLEQQAPRPPGANNASVGPQLLPHQLQAVAWLRDLAAKRLGGILADERGTGMTVAVVAYLVEVAKQQPQLHTQPLGPHAASPVPQLLVVPCCSVVLWRTELQLHAPRLRVGLLEDFLGCKSPRQKPVHAVNDSFGGPSDLVLCSTASLLSMDGARLKAARWSSVVIDARTTGVAPAGAAAVRELGQVLHRLEDVSSLRRVILMDLAALRADGMDKQHPWLLAFVMPTVFKAPHVARAVCENVKGNEGPQESWAVKTIAGMQLSRTVSECRGRPSSEAVGWQLLRCSLTSYQQVEYERLLPPADEPDGTLALGSDAADVSLRVLAARAACFHADLSFWLRPAQTPDTGSSSLPVPPLLHSSKCLPHKPLVEGVAAVAAAVEGISVTAWDDISVSPHAAEVSGRSGKLTMLQRVLQEFRQAGKKVLLLASLPHVLSLTHSFLCATEITHECAFASTSDSFMPTQSAIARFNVAGRSQGPAGEGPGPPPLLLAHPEACLFRGGVCPSEADVVIVLDDDWSWDRRRYVRQLLERLRVRRRAVDVYRLVAAGTVEEALWPKVEKGGDVREGRVGTTLAALAHAPSLEAGVETALGAKEDFLAQALAVRSDDEGLSASHCRECFSGRSVGTYGRRFLRGVDHHGGRLLGSPRPSLMDAGKRAAGRQVQAMLLEEEEQHTLALEEAHRALVKEASATTTNAQVLTEHLTEMRVEGMDVDPSVILPPVPPLEGLQELVPYPGWMDDPVDVDLGLLIRYVSVLETQQGQQKKRRLAMQQEVRRPQGYRSDTESEIAADGRPPRHTAVVTTPRPAVKVEVAMEWTTDEDAELLRAHDLYGRNPFIVPFALNKKASPYVRKRSSKQCFDRVDALLGQGVHQAGAARPQRPPPLLAFQAQVLPLPEVLDVSWSAIAPVKRLVRPADGENVLWTPQQLPPPDTDAQSRITKSFQSFTQFQGRLRQVPNIPEGTVSSSITTPFTLQQSTPGVSALNILESNRKSGAVGIARLGFGGGGGLMPTTPSPQPSITLPTPPPQSTIVNVGSLNPSLVPPPNATTIPGVGLGMGGAASKGIKTAVARRPGPANAPAATAGIPPAAPSPVVATATIPKQGKGARRSMGPAVRGQPAAPPTPPPTAQAQGSVPKAPTVTLPASMLQAQLGGGAPPLPTGVGTKRGRAALTPPSHNQLYMNQLMALIQKRPDMKTQIMQILSRQDLDDTQRIEMIGEILKAANIVTAAAWSGAGGGGPPPGGGGPPPSGSTGPTIAI